jgi:hypothetical protein
VPNSWLASRSELSTVSKPRGNITLSYAATASISDLSPFATESRSTPPQIYDGRETSTRDAPEKEADPLAGGRGERLDGLRLALAACQAGDTWSCIASPHC